MEIHWDILDNKRKSILPLFKHFADEGFYLAGETGLALQIGHRDSIDFDFFKKDDYDTVVLIKKLEAVFKNHKLSITQQDKNTVSCSIDNNIRLSFFSYNYELLKPLIRTGYFAIASIEDIACMKLSAIMSRAVEKDYVDLYFILQKISLDDLLDYCKKKYRSLDEMMILKSLPFFEDVQKEHILFKE
ncbi:MAG: nucleotidyl transferase AbiEii/AbiGii toxin family protein [Bacteroidales bacterium]